MHDVARRLDIWVYTFGGSSEAIYSAGRQYIFLNRHLTPQQQWQEFGHELCHILRHSGHQKKMNRSFVEYQEWQADYFALHFCVPTFMLDDIKNINIYKITNLFNIDYEFALKRLEVYLMKRRSLYALQGDWEGQMGMCR